MQKKASWAKSSVKFSDNLDERQVTSSKTSSSVASRSQATEQQPIKSSLKELISGDRTKKENLLLRHQYNGDNHDVEMEQHVGTVAAIDSDTAALRKKTNPHHVKKDHHHHHHHSSNNFHHQLSNFIQTTTAKGFYEEWDRILRVKDIHLLVFSVLGLSTSIGLSVYKWNYRCVVGPDDICLSPQPDTGTRVTATIANTVNDRVVSTSIIGCQVLLSFSTMVCIILIAQYYGLLLIERKRMWSKLNEQDLVKETGSEAARRQAQFHGSYKFSKSGLRWYLLLEVLIHIIHPVVFIEPWGGQYQTLYEVTEVLIFFRLYLVMRILFRSTDMYIRRKEIVNFNKELHRTGYTLTPGSIFKVTFYNNPGTMVGALTFATIAIFGFWMYVIERNTNPQFELLLDSVWFVWVTISTIGYGDMSAQSIMGRLVVILMAFTSLVIMTVFSGIMTNLLSPSREQRFVQSFLSQKRASAAYENAASVVLSNFLRTCVDGGQSTISSRVFKSFVTPELYLAIKRFRKAKSAMRDSAGAAADPVVDMKLQGSIFIAIRINRALDVQGEKIINLERCVASSAQAIRERLSLAQRGQEEKVAAAAIHGSGKSGKSRSIPQGARK